MISGLSIVVYGSLQAGFSMSMWLAEAFGKGKFMDA
jgi:hypothetical protein